MKYPSKFYSESRKQRNDFFSTNRIYDLRIISIADVNYKRRSK